MLKGIIFDFDGIIIDTETPYFQSWQETYAFFGIELSVDEWQSTVGSSSDPHYHYDQLEKMLGRTLNKEKIMSDRYYRQVELAKSQTVLPGVEKLIFEAKRLKLKVGLASSSGRDWVLPQLVRTHLLHHFDSIKCKDDCLLVKPSPELYNLVLQDFQINASQAIAFEDSINGVTAAKNAGIYCVAIPNTITCNHKILNADLILKSLDEISISQFIELKGTK